MRAFGESVDHLQDHFSPDTPDTEWLEYIGQGGFFLITRDDRIRRNPLEIRALRDYGVGAFFLGGKNQARWDLVQQLVRNWTQIKEVASRTRPPFAFRIPPKGTKFDRLPL